MGKYKEKLSRCSRRSFKESGRVAKARDKERSRQDEVHGIREQPWVQNGSAMTTATSTAALKEFKFYMNHLSDSQLEKLMRKCERILNQR